MKKREGELDKIIIIYPLDLETIQYSPSNVSKNQIFLIISFSSFDSLEDQSLCNLKICKEESAKQSQTNFKLLKLTQEANQRKSFQKKQIKCNSAFKTTKIYCSLTLQQEEPHEKQLSLQESHLPQEYSNYQSLTSANINACESIPYSILSDTTAQSNLNYNLNIPNNKEADFYQNVKEIEEIIGKTYFKQPESFHNLSQQLNKNHNINNSSVALYDFKGYKIESIGSLDGGKQVNPEEDAEYEDPLFENQELSFKRNDRYEETKNKNPPHFIFNFNCNFFQGNLKHPKGRSSVSLKRVDRIQEKVQNILNHKRERSENKDSILPSSKKSVVNSFFVSFEQEDRRNKNGNSNENCSLISNQSNSKFSFSEKKMKAKKMFQFGEFKKHLKAEPKEVVVDLSLNTGNKQLNSHRLRSSIQKSKVHTSEQLQKSDMKSLSLQRKNSNLGGAITTLGNMTIATTPIKNTTEINKINQTPFSLIERKTLDLSGNVCTPLKKRDTSKNNLVNNNASPFLENKVLKLKSINMQSVISKQISISDNQQAPQNQDLLNNPIENTPKRPLISFNSQKKTPQLIDKNNSINNKGASQYANTSHNPHHHHHHELFNSDISLANFQFESDIGKGSYAIVKIGIERNTGNIFVFKIYQKSTLVDPHKMRNVKREIQILKKLDHPRIIKMPFALQDKYQVNINFSQCCLSKFKHYCFIDCFSNGVFLQAVSPSQDQRRVSENEAKHIFKQITSGLDYCHSHGVVHRDVKIENILIEEAQRDIKIIDFGFSIYAVTKLKVYCGTPAYMSPEIVTKIEYCGKKADVWALGIVLFILVCGKFPFKGNTDADLFKKIRHCQYEIPAFLSEKCVSLIKRILRLNANERPNCSEILQDEWLSGM